MIPLVWQAINVWPRVPCKAQGSVQLRNVSYTAISLPTPVSEVSQKNLVRWLGLLWWGLGATQGKNKQLHQDSNAKAETGKPIWTIGVKQHWQAPQLPRQADTDKRHETTGTSGETLQHNQQTYLLNSSSQVTERGGTRKVYIQVGIAWDFYTKLHFKLKCPNHIC